jgi:GDP-4-dehydro-6-deoxy-D-mannose reductase
MGDSGAVYNLGSGTGVTIQEMLDMLLSLVDVPIRVEKDQSRVQKIDVPILICDSSIFRRKTGWEPTIPLKETLLRVLDYWRQKVTRI